MTAALTTDPPASQDHSGQELRALRGRAHLNTDTSDVAGMPRSCVRGGTRPLRTRPQPTQTAGSEVVPGFGTCGFPSICRASAMIRAGAYCLLSDRFVLRVTMNSL